MLENQYNDYIQHPLARLLCIATVLLTSACSAVIKKETPTIAHVHIGHSLTGWYDTPNKLGLLVTAEQEATIAAVNADLLIEAVKKSNLEKSRKYLTNIGHVLNPEKYPEGNGKGYGLRKATNGAISHLQFSADSPDASSNVLRSIARTSILATNAIERCDELLILIDEALQLEEIEILAELTHEIKTLANDIAGGDQKITSDAYGLYELRSDIEKMVDNEDPPYSTVESFYLFNLIRLPDGSWEFAKGRRRGRVGSY